MNDRVKTLGLEARKLTPEERFELVDEILADIHGTRSTVDAAWRREARDRLEAWRKGELPSRPIQDVLAKYLRR